MVRMASTLLKSGFILVLPSVTRQDIDTITIHLVNDVTPITAKDVKTVFVLLFRQNVIHVDLFPLILYLR